MDPKDKMEKSFMNLPDDQKEGIVGVLINHEKRQYWNDENYNHHVGLKAGDNTLEASITRLMTRHLIANKAFDQDKYKEDYEKWI